MVQKAKSLRRRLASSCNQLDLKYGSRSATKPDAVQEMQSLSPIVISTLTDKIEFG